MSTPLAINYCPCCGTDIKTLAVALQFSALKAAGGSNGNGHSETPERGPSKPWTDEEIVKVYRMKKEGSTAPEIAAALDRKLSSVNSALHSPSIQRRAEDLKERIDGPFSVQVDRAAVAAAALPDLAARVAPRSQPRTAIPLAEIQQVVALDKEGKAPPEIAAAMKCKLPRVYHMLKLAKEGRRPPKNKKHPGIRMDQMPVTGYETKRVIQLQKAGKTAVETAELMGTNLERIKTVKRAMRRKEGGG